jgi:hypothetical protein
LKYSNLNLVVAEFKLPSSVDKAVRSDEVVCVGFIRSCCTSSEVAVFILTGGRGRRVAVYKVMLMLLS